MNRHYEINQYMLQAYLDTGKPQIVGEVARALKTSANAVYAAADADHGRNWDRIEVEVPAGQYSNYTGRLRVVTALVPTRLRLRAVIAEQQQQLTEANALIAKLGEERHAAKGNGVQFTQPGAYAMFNALQTIVLTPSLRAWLDHVDPQALKQAVDAVAVAHKA